MKPTYSPAPDVGAKPDAATFAMLQLSLAEGLGPKFVEQLLQQFGSAECIVEASDATLSRVPGMGSTRIQKIRGAEHFATAEWQACHRREVDILARNHIGYPQSLLEICDPPTVLYVRGKLSTSDRRAIAIVGTRRPSNYGVQQARRLATMLSQCGFTVISGLARGIDAVAHRATMATGGRTLAIMAGGLGDIYPPEHRDLASQISEYGAVLSELALHRKPRRGAFPRRNRLIAGLSIGVIVVEARRRSGALITAGHALDQGREVFAVPGRVDSGASHGCHQLLREGARLVESVDDVLEELNGSPWLLSSVGSPTPDTSHLNERESAVFGAIQADATRIEEVATETQLPIHQVLATISVLEMRRLIERPTGDTVLRRVP